MTTQERKQARRLEGKVILITGAASGMGAATARLCAREGAAIIATDRQWDPLRTLEAELLAENKPILICNHDVASPQSWQQVVDQAIEKFQRIDGLVNGAGVIDQTPNMLEISPEAWRRVLDINLSGPFFGMQAVVPAMQRNGGGSIVNIASISGVIGNARGSGYTASKGGVRSLTKGAAIEFARDRIRINVIHPGYTETAMIANHLQNTAVRQHMLNQTPIGRLGAADDMAYAILYLLSDESGFVTGAEFFIDGGMTAI